MADINLDLPTHGDTQTVGAQKLLTALQAISGALNDAIALAAAAVPTGGGTPPPPPVNQPPTAKITITSQSNLAVSLSAANSVDPDGTIASYQWAFGDGTTATGVYATHTYPASGQYTATLTITDNSGATSTASTTVTASAPVTTTAYTQDTGLGTNNGAQVTGAGFVALTMSGSDAGVQASAVGSGRQLSLPVGTSQKLNGWTSSQQNAANITGGGGIIGAGSAKSVLAQIPNSTTGVTGQYASMLIRSTAAGAVFQDFTLQGTDQSAGQYHGGISVSAANTTLRRVVFRRAGVGDDKAPPGETFAVNCYGFQGGLYLEDVEIDGIGTGASGFATNGSGSSSADGRAIGDYTVNRLYSHDNWYSGAIALWQQAGTATFNDCTFDRSRCFWNIERCAGKVILNRPRIGTLKAATSGWANGPASPVHIYAEAGTGWTTQAEAQAFRFIINDPRNLNGTPYSGPPITMTLGGATGGTNFYTKATTFKAYSASGADISSTFYA